MHSIYSRLQYVFFFKMFKTFQNSSSHHRVRKCQFWAGWRFCRMTRRNPTSFSWMILTEVNLIQRDFIWWCLSLLTSSNVFGRERLQVSDWRSVLCHHVAQEPAGGVSEETTSGEMTILHIVKLTLLNTELTEVELSMLCSFCSFRYQRISCRSSKQTCVALNV